MKTQAILGVDTNPKTVKGTKQGYSTGIVYLAPSDESGIANTCPNASKGCREACLFTAGRGTMDNVRNPRIKKTKNFLENKGAMGISIKKRDSKRNQKSNKK